MKKRHLLTSLIFTFTLLLTTTSHAQYLDILNNIKSNKQQPTSIYSTLDKFFLKSVVCKIGFAGIGCEAASVVGVENKEVVSEQKSATSTIDTDTQTYVFTQPTSTTNTSPKTTLEELLKNALAGKVQSTTTPNNTQSSTGNTATNPDGTYPNTYNSPYFSPSPIYGGALVAEKEGETYSDMRYYSTNGNALRYGSPASGGGASVTTTDFNNYRTINNSSVNCEPFGMNNKAANINKLKEKTKFDVNRICLAFSKKVTVVDAVRGCNGPSRHCFGEAIDFEVNSYGDKKQQVLLVMSFIALGYNIGSYENNFPLHADNEAASYWKTWSRWAHKNGQSPLPYQQQVKDALSLIGYNAGSAADFRATYGRPSREVMSSKAKAFLKKIGDPNIEKYILSDNFSKQ